MVCVCVCVAGGGGGGGGGGCLPPAHLVAGSWRYDSFDYCSQRRVSTLATHSHENMGWAWVSFVSLPTLIVLCVCGCFFVFVHGCTWGDGQFKTLRALIDADNAAGIKEIMREVGAAGGPQRCV